MAESGPVKSAVSSIEQEIDSMPLVDEDAADLSDEESGRIASARPLSSLTTNGGANAPQIPHETVIESMPSSGMGSPSAGPGCE